MSIRGEQQDRVGTSRVIKRMRPPECFARLRTSPLGRLVFEQAGRLMLLPVTFAVTEDDIVVFRTAPGAKLTAARDENGRVTFQADHLSAAGTGWWVTVRGQMQEVRDRGARAALDHLGLEPWADDVPRDAWLCVVPDTVEGWRT